VEVFYPHYPINSPSRQAIRSFALTVCAGRMSRVPRSDVISFIFNYFQSKENARLAGSEDRELLS
jgi:hypothetical protein